jgi:hypothetical protein
MIPGSFERGIMAENLDILNAAVSLVIKAALLAARFSGRVRRRSLKRLAAMDTDAKAKEILFLKDKVYQLEMQVSILQKQLTKRGKNPRYTVRERLLILWHMEAFQIPRRKVTKYFGIATSTLYRWLHKIEDQKPSGTSTNKTPVEIASLVWEITQSNLSWGRIRIANQLGLLNIFISAAADIFDICFLLFDILILSAIPCLLPALPALHLVLCSVTTQSSKPGVCGDGRSCRVTMSERSADPDIFYRHRLSGSRHLASE